MDKPVYCFIINYNRLTLPRKMADFIADSPGAVPIIVDNCSTYGPLLSYYDTCPHRVLRMKRNFGNCVLWHGPGNNQAILNEYGLNGNFIVTDPDLEIDHIPKDWLHELQTGLDHYPDVAKAGFGLMIDDLPDTPIGRQARGNQGFEWNHPVENGRFYKASIDTTFCLCRTRLHAFNSVRTGPPYLARHKPWYYTCKEDIPEDELYYLKSVTPGKWNYWAGRIQKEFGL